LGKNRLAAAKAGKNQECGEVSDKTHDMSVTRG
jgi:hypothetical protein